MPTRATAYLREARAAYSLIHRGLLTSVAAGPWIRLYAFQSTPVLNAQLQTVLSLESYAGIAGDSAAAAFAHRMQVAAAETLPRFDTGYWTYYSLAGDPSPLDYQQFVVQLLTKLAPTDPRFASAATRIAAYQHQPPAFMLANTTLGSLRFWLSKPSSVQVLTSAGPTKRVGLDGGWHTLSWGEPKRAGVYPLQVNAVDWAGNRATFQPLPFVRVTAQTTNGAERATDATSPTPPPAFVVGAGLDDPSEAPQAKSLGMKLLRLTVAWPADATTPDPTVVSALQNAATSAPLVVELSADPMPADSTNQAALAQYAATLVQQVPGIRELVLTPSADVVDYPVAFAAVRAAVQAAVPGEPVGVSIDGSVGPRTAALALASTTTDFVDFRPAPAAGTGLWTTPNVPQLLSALGQNVPVLVDGVPANGAASAITSLACDPSVTGAIVDSLSGIDATSLKSAAASAQRGLVVCPGLAVPAAATGLTFPTQLASSTPASATFGCARDCLYLLTLDNGNGKPVVARRGALRGGTSPVVVSLPQAKLQSGTYRIDVRLVNQVNPGPVAQQLSPPLAVP